MKEFNQNKQFSNIAREISNIFPELDLLFNHKEGTNRMRVKIENSEKEILDIYLDSKFPINTINETILEIKKLIRHFDA